MNSYQRSRGGFTVTTDPARLDLGAVHAFLAQTYWSEAIPLPVLARAVANSLCFSLLAAGEGQIGLARVITDHATFAYLCDVYVLPSHRGQGLGRWLMECVMAHPDLAGLRRFSLVTRDAHGLYLPFGFSPLAQPDRHLEISRPGLYRNAAHSKESAP
jgi:GNAT superfamily N-acetyltransferase